MTVVTTDLYVPNDKIDIPGDAKSRDGGVKYTDYALNKFLQWLKNNLGSRILFLLL
jgi:hypothetical protein